MKWFVTTVLLLLMIAIATFADRSSATSSKIADGEPVINIKSIRTYQKKEKLICTTNTIINLCEIGATDEVLNLVCRKINVAGQLIENTNTINCDYILGRINE